VPLLKRAQKLVKETSELKIFASPWSPPAWMKNNGRFNGSGSLIPAMRQPYADYIVKSVLASTSNWRQNIMKFSRAPYRLPLYETLQQYKF
jgi:O-glycosyl hydrolase